MPRVEPTIEDRDSRRRGHVPADSVDVRPNGYETRGSRRTQLGRCDWDEKVAARPVGCGSVRFAAESEPIRVNVTRETSMGVA